MNDSILNALRAIFTALITWGYRLFFQAYIKAIGLVFMIVIGLVLLYLVLKFVLKVELGI